MSKIIQVSRSKYRTAVSDLLPYEKPLFFSNRFFARFLKYYGVQTDNGSLVATKHHDSIGLKEVLSFLGGRPGDERNCFQYNITKDGHSDSRTLSLIHPYHQVEIIEFYDKYKQLILYFCSRSNFSIRYPYRIASCQTKHDERLKIYSDTSINIDSSEGIKHFFAYKKYDKINEFYDDFQFLNSEKKYAYLRKIDLKKCFESIDADSLSKAMFDCEMSECVGSMSYLFANIQKKSHSKNEGIVIGPEFSRLFAEIILQRIDVEAEKCLSHYYGLINKENYRLFRYVDDEFIFCHNKDDADTIEMVYSNFLSTFCLKINYDKTSDFNERPFVEEISLIKYKFSDLVSKMFANRLETFTGFYHLQNGTVDTPMSIGYRDFVNAIRLAMKTGLNPHNNQVVKYKDVMSFLLGIMQSRQHTLYKQFNDLYKEYAEAEYNGIISDEGLKVKKQYEEDFISFNMELVQILFFLFCCDKRMSTSIKVVSIINKMQLFVSGKYIFEDHTVSNKFPVYFINNLNSLISHETQDLLSSSKLCENNAMEILNILEVQKSMNQSTQISELSLMSFLESGENDFSEYLNFMTAFELLHFMGKSNKYNKLKEEIFKWVDTIIIPRLKKGASDTETILTMFELICCPYIDEEKRVQYSKLIFADNSNRVLDFCRKHKDMFIRWRKYRVEEELQLINNKEVY